jgi:hypothetical protein
MRGNSNGNSKGSKKKKDEATVFLDKDFQPMKQNLKLTKTASFKK